MKTVPNFVLYFRAYCGLCHEMLAALEAYQKQYRFTIDIVDIDDSEDVELIAKYDELVPVLMWQDQEICHWHLAPDKLIACLAASNAKIR